MPYYCDFEGPTQYQQISNSPDEMGHLQATIGQNLTPSLGFSEMKRAYSYEIGTYFYIVLHYYVHIFDKLRWVATRT